MDLTNAQLLLSFGKGQPQLVDLDDSGIAFVDPVVGLKANGAPVSGVRISAPQKIRKIVSAVGQASYRRASLGYHSHSIAQGADCTDSGGVYNAAAGSGWNTQSQAAVLAKVLSGAGGGVGLSVGITAGGPGNAIHPLLTVGGGAYATADGAFGPGGWRVVLAGPAHTVKFIAVGTAIRVYAVASGAGSTTPVRWSAPSVSGGALQNSTLPAATPNPGNTPANNRTWNDFTISPVVPGEEITITGPTAGEYSIHFIDNDYRPTTPGVTVHRLAQSGASLADLSAAAFSDNLDTTGRAAWLGAGQAAVRLGQQQSMSVRVPLDGIVFCTDGNDMNDWAAKGYTLADLRRHLTNYLVYQDSLGLQVLALLGPYRDPALNSVGIPWTQTQLLTEYKTVIDAAPNAAYLDLTAEFGADPAAGYAAQVAAGLMVDPVHPGKLGHGYFGTRIGRAILAAA